MSPMSQKRLCRGGPAAEPHLIRIRNWCCLICDMSSIDWSSFIHPMKFAPGCIREMHSLPDEGQLNSSMKGVPKKFSAPSTALPPARICDLVVRKSFRIHGRDLLEQLEQHYPVQQVTLVWRTTWAHRDPLLGSAAS